MKRKTEGKPQDWTKREQRGRGSRGAEEQNLELPNP
jgi:hypothetical protein